MPVEKLFPCLNSLGEKPAHFDIRVHFTFHSLRPSTFPCVFWIMSEPATKRGKEVETVHPSRVLQHAEGKELKEGGHLC